MLPRRNVSKVRSHWISRKSVDPKSDLGVTENSKWNLVIWDNATVKQKSSRRSETSTAFMAYGCVPGCLVICENSLSLQPVALFPSSVCNVHSRSTSTFWGCSSVALSMSFFFSAHCHISGGNFAFWKALPWCSVWLSLVKESYYLE